MSLELLDAEVDPEGVGSLKGKIVNAISSSVDQSSQLENRIVLERDTHLIGDRFTLIRHAIEKRSKLEIEYFSLTRNQTTRRKIRPYFLMKKLGYWYLTGHCELRDDLRTFKFERIQSAQDLEEFFSEPKDIELGRYKADFDLSSGERRIEIYFDKQLAPWIREQWDTSVRAAQDGGVILTLYSETLEFPSRLVLRSAPHAKPLSPPEFIEKVRQDAADIMQLQGCEA
jgi:predicted DNA-binding transcriptional regulator YafY